MSQFLPAYFKAHLESLELPSSDIRFSLGYSQGDGVAFYGSVEGAYVLRIAREQLLPRGEVRRYRNIETAFREGRASVKIEKARAFQRYDHYNTMCVEIDPGNSELGDADLRELADAITDEIQRVSRYLEQRAYCYIERECNAPRVLHKEVICGGELEIKLVAPTEDYDFDDSPDSLSLTELESFISDCERGAIVMGDLVATFVDQRGESRSESMFNLCIDPNAPHSWMGAADDLRVELDLPRFEPPALELRAA